MNNKGNKPSDIAMTHHRLYGYARDRHEITWNLRFTDIRRERRIIPDGRKSYLALSDEVQQ